MGEIEYKTSIGEDVDIIVYFEIQPEEKQTRDYPGCPMEVIFNDITLVDGPSITDLLRDEVIEGLKAECTEHANELAADSYYI